MLETELLSKEEWLKAVETCAGSPVDIIDCSIRPLNVTGGFLGEHHLAAVTVLLLDSTHPQRVLKFFIKREPNLFETQRRITEQSLSFEKEVFALSDLFPKIRKSLKDNGEGMKWTCECFYTRPDLIVLEDLSQDYFTLESRGPIDYEYVALAMKALANMHSASIIYEEKQTNQPYRLGNEFPKLLTETFFKNAENHPGPLWVKSGTDTLWLLVKIIRGEEIFLRLKNDLEDAMKLIFEFQKPSEIFRNAIGQGDIKRDNILFKCENNVPVDAKIVDFQLLRYVPPANDVMCHLYIATNRVFRKNYATQLLKLYHDHLSENLRIHGLNPDEVFSWRQFKESCDYYKSLGVIIAPCYASCTFFKPEHISHVFDSNEAFENFFVGNRVPEVMNAFRTDPIYRQLITDTIDELLEFVEDRCHTKYLFT